MRNLMGVEKCKGDLILLHVAPGHHDVVLIGDEPIELLEPEGFPDQIDRCGHFVLLQVALGFLFSLQEITRQNF